jgi:hypothetical protein
VCRSYFLAAGNVMYAVSDRGTTLRNLRARVLPVICLSLRSGQSCCYVALARAATAEQRATEADQWRAEADAAAEEMAAQLTTAQTRADQAETTGAAAETARDGAVERAARTPTRGSPRTKRSGTPRSGRSAPSSMRWSALPKSPRDQALAQAKAAEQTAGLAQQETARAQAAAAAQAETSRVRADAERMLAEFRVDAARDRDEQRADLQTCAERAERQADPYGDELAQLRAGIAHAADPITSHHRHPDATTRQAGHQAVTPLRQPPRTGRPLWVLTYRSSFVSRMRSFTFAKMASWATRGMSSQIAEAATQRSASWSFPPSPCPVLAHQARTVT